MLNITTNIVVSEAFLSLGLTTDVWRDPYVATDFYRGSIEAAAERSRAEQLQQAELAKIADDVESLARHLEDVARQLPHGGNLNNEIATLRLAAADLRSGRAINISALLASVQAAASNAASEVAIAQGEANAEWYATSARAAYAENLYQQAVHKDFSPESVRDYYRAALEGTKTHDGHTIDRPAADAAADHIREHHPQILNPEYHPSFRVETGRKVAGVVADPGSAGGQAHKAMKAARAVAPDIAALAEQAKKAGLSPENIKKIQDFIQNNPDLAPHLKGAHAYLKMLDIVARAERGELKGDALRREVEGLRDTHAAITQRASNDTWARLSPQEKAALQEAYGVKSQEDLEARMRKHEELYNHPDPDIRAAYHQQIEDLRRMDPAKMSPDQRALSLLDSGWYVRDFSIRQQQDLANFQHVAHAVTPIMAQLRDPNLSAQTKERLIEEQLKASGIDVNIAGRQSLLLTRLNNHLTPENWDALHAALTRTGADGRPDPDIKAYGQIVAGALLEGRSDLKETLAKMTGPDGKPLNAATWYRSLGAEQMAHLHQVLDKYGTVLPSDIQAIQRGENPLSPTLDTPERVRERTELTRREADIETGKQQEEMRRAGATEEELQGVGQRVQRDFGIVYTGLNFGGLSGNGAGAANLQTADWRPAAPTAFRTVAPGTVVNDGAAGSGPAADALLHQMVLTNDLQRRLREAQELAARAGGVVHSTLPHGLQPPLGGAAFPALTAGGVNVFWGNPTSMLTAEELAKLDPWKRAALLEGHTINAAGVITTTSTPPAGTTTGTPAAAAGTAEQVTAAAGAARDAGVSGGQQVAATEAASTDKAAPAQPGGTAEAPKKKETEIT